MNIVTRKQAIQLGLAKYSSDVPCRHGNIAERRVNNSSCLCASCKTDRITFAMKWRHKNPEKCKQHARTQRAKDADKIALRKKKIYQRNKDAIQKKQYEYRRSNIEELKLSKKRYYLQNKERCAALNKKRKLSKRRAVPSWFGELDEFIFSEAYRLAQKREELIGFEWHVDHMIPLRAEGVCGLHVWNNVQVIPGSLNLKKRNRLAFTSRGEWLKVLA